MPVDVATRTVAALGRHVGTLRDIVLEARGRNGLVTWHLGAEAGIARRALAVVGSHLAELRASDSKAPAKADTAGVIRLAGHRSTQLSVGSTDEAARGVLGALAAARRTNWCGCRSSSALVIVLVWCATSQLEQRASVNAKYGEHRFSCEAAHRRQGRRRRSEPSPHARRDRELCGR